MSGADVGLVLGAGMAAAFNPCGVAMLPSYVSYLVGQGQGESSSLWRNGLCGAAVGLWMTLGFLTVFVILGFAISVVGRILYAIIPWLSVVIGVLLAVLGVLLLLGKHMEVNTARYVGRLDRKMAAGRRLSMYLYGIAYAVASLGCTLPIFLMLVAQSLLLGHTWQGIVNFILYAAGMGLVVVAVSVLSLMANAWLSVRLRHILPFVSRISAVIILGAGLYVLYYWLIGHRMI